MSRLRIAAAAYPLDPLTTFADYEAKATRWVEEAARDGAQLLVFPEYGAMELAHLAGAPVASDLQSAAAAAHDAMPQALVFLARLAAKHGVFICGPTGPERGADGRYRNVARLLGPAGGVGAQQKRMMTRFEDEEWGIAPGAGLAVFDTPLARIGIATCFDIEFPLIARAFVEAGAEIILAPSCTEQLAGYWRVRVGAQARALENQCVTVHAPLVGEAHWCPAVDRNTGAAGVFGPPDRGFPDTGVIALGEINTPGWVFADVSREAIAEVRARGAVFNHKRWPEQPGAHVLRAVDVVKLA